MATGRFPLIALDEPRGVQRLLAGVLLAPELFAIAKVIEFNADVEVVAMLRNTACEQCLDLQRIARLLNVNRLAFVMEGHAVGNHLEARQLCQAVVNTFRNAIRNVIRFRIGAAHIER